jgi:hypothetical protein
MQSSSTPRYGVSDAEKGSLPSSQGSGDAILDIDSRATTLALRGSDLKSFKYHATKDTTEPTEYKPSNAEIERDIRETITIPCRITSITLTMPHTE